MGFFSFEQHFPYPHALVFIAKQLSVTCQEVTWTYNQINFWLDQWLCLGTTNLQIYHADTYTIWQSFHVYHQSKVPELENKILFLAVLAWEII